MAHLLPFAADADILSLLARHPAGLRIDALLAALRPAPTRRTLQRRLQALVQAQQLLAEGAGPARRYRRPSFLGEETPDPSRLTGRPPATAAPSGARSTTAAAPALQGDLPPDAPPEAIRAALRLPLSQRRPVGWQIGFLEAYTPNVTPYLGADLRAQLLALGRSGVSAQAPAGTFARDILARLLIDLSWASSRLEGNTYSRLDTERLIAHGQAADGKDALETQMILNHKAAIEYLAGTPEVAVDAPTVFALHALLSDGLLADPMAGGRVRQRAVEIGGSVYRPLALPQRLDELFHIVLAMAAEITDPFEQAFFLMVHLPYLQPFEDVNKRTSRLAANIPLLRHNLCPLSFLDVPVDDYVEATLAVYELQRVDLLRELFVQAYARSCQQYVAVQQQLVPPDLFRLRWRAEISLAVQALVQRGLRLTDGNLRRVTPAAVPADQRARFLQQLHTEFATLHAGNVVRFGLRALEWQAWQHQQQARPAR
ncbi:MAG TPA: Fic family protein [Aquabacterium sp.]|nr:Fic family protein [Aquabacterium sp.]HQC95818.1 Fic family protein [Aquabacterium sp.]